MGHPVEFNAATDRHNIVDFGGRDESLARQCIQCIRYDTAEATFYASSCSIHHGL